MFDATRLKFRDISFQQVNYDDPASFDLKSKYKVWGVPKLIFLDDKGTMLYNAGIFADQKSFAEAINRYH